MPEEKPASETPATEPTEQPAEQKKVKVTLKVPMSEADLGHAAQAGDEVEVDADVAERWIAAGIAEAAGTQEKAPNATTTTTSSASSPTGTTSTRRSGTA
jgi:hypothetical protein